ncbi:hypothetical protein Z043_109073, partial [Scleropages formosus]
MSTDSRDEDLDVTVEPTAEEPGDGTMETPAEGPADGSPKSSKETVEAVAGEGVEPSRPEPLSLLEREPEDERSRQALKKLLDRVRAQQMQRGRRSGSEISAAATESMSIESGSLSSQERVSLQPEPTSPAQGPPEPPREQSEEGHRIEAERKKRVHGAQGPHQDEHSRKIREYQHRLLERS